MLPRFHLMSFSVLTSYTLPPGHLEAFRAHLVHTHCQTLEETWNNLQRRSSIVPAFSTHCSRVRTLEKAKKLSQSFLDVVKITYFSLSFFPSLWPLVFCLTIKLAAPEKTLFFLTFFHTYVMMRRKKSALLARPSKISQWKIVLKECGGHYSDGTPCSFYENGPFPAPAQCAHF